ncbi:hypothetical protein [Actinoplanes awajinensis]|uniref:hypothetical protein n=1 Tax=Actinoplanes awajinensis TaxID=135946 RepID=UPI000AE66963|nr:hypothetical protein [Actinoplanes awajinensis]
MSTLDRLLRTRWWIRKWWLLHRLTDRDEALERLTAYAEDADDPDLYLLHLALVRRAGEVGPATATREVRTYVRQVPDYAVAGAGAYKSYLAGGDPQMLDIAIAIFEKAAALTGEGLPERSTVLSNFGLVLTERHDLPQALDTLAEAVRCAPDPDRHLAATVNYASALTTSGDPATAATLLDGLDAPQALAALGHACLELFRIAGDPVDLDRAVAALDSVAAPDDPRWLTNLGVALSERHLLTGRPDDLDRAVALLRAAVAASTPGSPDRPARLADLGSVLAERGPADLDEAVVVLREALRDTAPGSPDHPDWQQNLALVLRDRYVRDGDLPDLEQARTLLEPYADSAPDQLAVTLRMRWQRRGDPADLDRAVTLHRIAIAETGPHAAVVHNNASGTYRALWTATGDPAALGLALDAYRAALAALPATSPERPAALANLSMGLLNRHTVTGDRADADEAVAVARHAGQALKLANVLRARYELGGDPRDAEEAEDAYRSAVVEPTLGETWLRSAQAYGDWATSRQHWPDAAGAYGAAVTAADRLLRRQLSPADVEAWLFAVRTLPAAAAYAHLRLGETTTAVDRLEWGRARLLTDALERDRADLRALAETAPDLAARYRTAAVRLRTSEVRR